MAVSGCGPTCIAMVACGLTGRNDITPAKVASYSANNGFLTESRDTSWDLMTYGAEEYGITGTELGLDEAAMANQLAAGPSYYCQHGAGGFHFQRAFYRADGLCEWFLHGERIPTVLFEAVSPGALSRLKNQIVNLWYYTVL